LKINVFEYKDFIGIKVKKNVNV